MVIINGFFYNLHVLLGDPVVPAGSPPAIPIITAFLTDGYEMGPERTQALIAMQLILGLIFLVFGLHRYRRQDGTLGAELREGRRTDGRRLSGHHRRDGETGRFWTYPISITVGVLVAYFCLFSPIWANLRRKYKAIDLIGKFGMLPAIIIGVVLGPIAKEIAVPAVQLWPLIRSPSSATSGTSCLPLPSAGPARRPGLPPSPPPSWCISLPLATSSPRRSCSAPPMRVRQDEKIDFNANRSNVISGIRNVAMALCCPYTQTCGPLWAAVTAAVSQRYKEGPKAMESIYSGAGTFRWCTFICVALIPISSLLQPVLPVALSLTLIVQGFICTQLAMNMCRTDIERGICGVMGACAGHPGCCLGTRSGSDSVLYAF